MLLSPLNNTNCDDSSYRRFWRICFCICIPLGFSWGFPYFIICIYCYARTGYLRSRILSLDIPVFDTPLYIYNHALVILVRYVIDRSVALSSCDFCLPLFFTKAPSYNQSFILLYVLNFCFRGRNTLPSLNYDLSIRLCMVGCYIMDQSSSFL